MRRILIVFVLLVVTACGQSSSPTLRPTHSSTPTPLDGQLFGMIEGDWAGPAAFVVVSAVAERYHAIAPDVRVDFPNPGFCEGQADLLTRDRRMTAEEAAMCQVEVSRFTIAMYAMVVVAHPGNDFITCLTVDDLATLLAPDSDITTWSDLNPAYPAESIAFYLSEPHVSVEHDFAEAILGERVNLRRGEGVTTSSDNHVLLQGTASNPYAIGLMDYAYYEANRSKVRAIAIENPTGKCVTSTVEAIHSGAYAPLSRSLYVYANTTTLRQEPHFAHFMGFLFSEEGVPAIIDEVGLTPPPEGTFSANRALLDRILRGENP